jgi:hypothetical protein
LGDQGDPAARGSSAPHARTPRRPHARRQRVRRGEAARTDPDLPAAPSSVIGSCSLAETIANSSRIPKDRWRGIGPMSAAALGVILLHSAFAGLEMWLASRLGVADVLSRPEQVLADVLGFAAIGGVIGLVALGLWHTLTHRADVTNVDLHDPNRGERLNGVPHTGWFRPDRQASQDRAAAPPARLVPHAAIGGVRGARDLQVVAAGRRPRHDVDGAGDRDGRGAGMRGRLSRSLWAMAYHWVWWARHRASLARPPGSGVRRSRRAHLGRSSLAIGA